MRNIGSDGGNDTANFVSKDPAIGGFAGIKRESLEPDFDREGVADRWPT